MTLLAVAHAVHYGLVVGGVAVLVVLLWATPGARPRPGATRSWRAERAGTRSSRAERAGTRAWRAERADVAAHLARLERAALAELQPSAALKPDAERPATTTGREPWVGVAVVASVGAAAVHAAAFPAHLRESALLGAFFCGCALAQLGWAVLAACRPGTLVRLAGALGSLAVVALWLWTRKVGVPVVAPAVPEAVGAWDSAATLLELVTAGACLRRWTATGSARAAFGPPARTLAVVTGLVLAGLAVTGAPS